MKASQGIRCKNMATPRIRAQIYSAENLKITAAEDEQPRLQDNIMGIK